MIFLARQKLSNSKKTKIQNRLVFSGRKFINAFFPICLLIFLLLSQRIDANPTLFFAPAPTLDFDFLTLSELLGALFFEVLVVYSCISYKCFNARSFITKWFLINIVSFILFSIFVVAVSAFLGSEWGFIAIIIGELLVTYFEAKVLQIFSKRFVENMFYSEIDFSLAIRCTVLGNFSSILIYAICYKYIPEIIF